MVWNQWLLAQQCGLKWANRKGLRDFHNTLVDDFGVEEIIYYFGSPCLVPESIREASIADFIDLPGASFAMDAVYESWHFDRCIPTMEFIRRENHTAKIYTENHPRKDVDPAMYGSLTNGSIQKTYTNWAKDLENHAVDNWQGDDYELISICHQPDEEVIQTRAIIEWGAPPY
jgi:hypothetical protein